MYPSMPSFAPPAPESYGYNAPPPQQQPYGYTGQAQPYQYAPPQQPQQPQQQWAAPPQSYDPHAARNAPHVIIPSQPELSASAPPPVDLASHPSSSPRSITTAMPSAPQRTVSYASTSPSQPTQIATSWGSQSAQQQQQHSYPQQQYEQAEPSANGYLPQLYPPQQQQQAPPQQHQQPYQDQAQQPSQQNVYSAASFPPAPAAVFPDAPSAEPTGLEKKEADEPLLIEL